MRSMRYTCYTYCLKPENYPTGNNGDILTLGSRDKYWFTPSRRDGTAEIYIMRFNDGRSTKIDQKEYQIVVIQLESCGSSEDIQLETGDIILGIASSQVPRGEGSGCTPYLYLLRPVYQRNTGTVNNPYNRRVCT